MFLDYLKVLPFCVVKFAFSFLSCSFSFLSCSFSFLSCSSLFLRYFKFSSFFSGLIAFSVSSIYGQSMGKGGTSLKN